MTVTVRDVMTANPETIDAGGSVAEASRIMRDRDIGTVIVTKPDGGVCGIVTDRDIVVRVIAEGKDPANARIDEACGHTLHSVSADDSTREVVKLMKEQALRRAPVMDHDRVVGIVSLGDLAIEFDRESALGEISAAPPND